MSLELNKLTHKIEDLGAALAERTAELEQAVPAAKAVLDTIGVADETLWRKLGLARGRWAGAFPTEEPVNAAIPLPPHPPRVNAIAADGSQVYPDRHGVALYYLINIGSIVFRHGQTGAPVVRSQPEMFFENADLYEEDGGLIPSAMIDIQRDIAELGELARLAADEAKTAPTVALLDNGLLLYITLQTPNQQLIDDALRDYLAHLETLWQSGAAVAGVVDRPRAQNVIRLLRLAQLDESEINEETLRAWGPFQRLSDGRLFRFLRPGERSALFVNASPANLDRYRDHRIHFFYVNAGRPGKDSLLRIEVPEWVARDSQKLDLVHAVVVEQCRVPDGFPYALMRAHELAVVTVGERRELDQMVVGSLVRRGLSPSISQKAQGKAWTGAGKRRHGK